MNWVEIGTSLVNLDATLAITLHPHGGAGDQAIIVVPSAGDPAVIAFTGTRDQCEKQMVEVDKAVTTMVRQDRADREPFFFVQSGPLNHNPDRGSCVRLLTREEWQAEETRAVEERLAHAIAIERARCEAEAAGGKVDHPLESPTYPFPRD